MSWRPTLRPTRRRDGRSTLRVVGILANEFFDRKLGRMGGFGWAARTSAEALAAAPEVGYAPLFLVGKGERLRGATTAEHASGVRLVRHDANARRYSRALERTGLAVFLTVDFRPNYTPVLGARRAPVVVWVRDPWTADDRRRISTLTLPASGETPRGVEGHYSESLAELIETYGSRVVLASPAPGIARAKTKGAYGVDVDDVAFLPNPVAHPADEPRPSGRPSVVFLARLDPVKRPWMFVELARRFPTVDFLMLGQSHFSGPGSWSPPDNPPSNLRLLGHVDGTEKAQILGSAWMLVNPSIHEGLPVSFLEALHAGTPIVSCQDPEGVTSRFGRYVGRWEGSGLDGLDAFEEAIEQLLEDADLRQRLGAEGRDWARANHTPERFLEAFVEIVDSLGE